MSNTFGQLINKLRKEKGLSLRELADKSNLSHSYIDKLEKGIDPRSGKPVIPTLDTIKRLAQGLDVNLIDLMLQGNLITEKDVLRLWNAMQEEDYHNDSQYKPLNSLNDIDIVFRIYMGALFEPLGISPIQALSFFEKDKKTNFCRMKSKRYPELRILAQRLYGLHWRDAFLSALNDEFKKQMVLLDKDSILEQEYYIKLIEDSPFANDPEIKEPLTDFKKHIENKKKEYEQQIPPNIKTVTDLDVFFSQDNLVYKGVHLTPAEKERLKDFMEIAMEIIRKDDSKKPQRTKHNGEGDT